MELENSEMTDMTKAAGADERQLVVRSGDRQTSAPPGHALVGSEYTACVERILADFRTQAQLLIGEQMKLHNQQAVSNEQVLSCSRVRRSPAHDSREHGVPLELGACRHNRACHGLRP